MLDFMREGGWAMWLVLAMGGVALGVAVSFAVRPRERKLGILRPLSVATVFVTLSGVASGIKATMHHVTTHPEWSQDLARYGMIGIGESITNAVLGFGLLGLAWLVTAVGMRRQT
jgi:hypothetical protein